LISTTSSLDINNIIYIIINNIILIIINIINIS